ncbi:hypothetical protein GMES_2133 [Paraglaciecola mesophila KMM 241]|uniref:Uncharacterized protein n=1 Tax=Paraglaciecola mesophila KMM 241 TaxID=1128912 RepID=K6XUY6_9ALTE|nr:hypothetical protein GMES_2133 [Paraglaciecola mesophila KMM 241]
MLALFVLGHGMIAPDECLSGIAHLPLLMQIVIYQKLASPFIKTY